MELLKGKDEQILIPIVQPSNYSTLPWWWMTASQPSRTLEICSGRTFCLHRSAAAQSQDCWETSSDRSFSLQISAGLDLSGRTYILCSPAEPEKCSGRTSLQDRQDKLRHNLQPSQICRTLETFNLHGNCLERTFIIHYGTIILDRTSFSI